MDSGGRGCCPRGVVVAALCLAACASSRTFRPLDVDALTRRAPRTVIVAISDTPPFRRTAAARFVPIPMGPGQALWVGALHAAMAHPGVRSSTIFDPSTAAGTFIVNALVQRFGLRETDRGEVVTVAATPEALANDYRGVDLILDIRTIDWGLLANRDNRLRLAYVGTFRLIDGRTGAVLAEETCSNPEPRSDTEQPPVLEAWVFEGAALLRQELWATATRCADDFISRVLRIR